MQLQVCCGVHSACRRQGAAAGAPLWKGLLFALAEARPAEFLDILLHLSPSPVGTLGLQMCMAVSRLRDAQGYSQRSARGSISPSPQTPVVFWTLGAPGSYFPCSDFLFFSWGHGSWDTGQFLSHEPWGFLWASCQRTKAGHLPGTQRTINILCLAQSFPISTPYHGPLNPYHKMYNVSLIDSGSC